MAMVGMPEIRSEMHTAPAARIEDYRLTLAEK